MVQSSFLVPRSECKTCWIPRVLHQAVREFCITEMKRRMGDPASAYEKAARKRQAHRRMRWRERTARCRAKKKALAAAK